MPARNASLRRRWSSWVRKPDGVLPRSRGDTGHRLFGESSDVSSMLVGATNGGRPEGIGLGEAAVECISDRLVDLRWIGPGCSGINDRTGGSRHSEATVVLDFRTGQRRQVYLERRGRAMKRTRYGDVDAGRQNVGEV